MLRDSHFKGSWARSISDFMRSSRGSVNCHKLLPYRRNLQDIMIVSCIDVEDVSTRPEGDYYGGTGEDRRVCDHESGAGRDSTTWWEKITKKNGTSGTSVVEELRRQGKHLGTASEDWEVTSSPLWAYWVGILGIKSYKKGRIVTFWNFANYTRFNLGKFFTYIYKKVWFCIRKRWNEKRVNQNCVGLGK